MYAIRLIRLPLLLSLMLALATLLPARAEVFNPKSRMLDNGLQVVVVENHRAPVVTHMVWYKVGAMDEPPGKSGIAHFLEHLMFRGTTSLEDGEFSALVARNGGQENAFTGQDYTGYYQSVASDRLELMMKIEADRMQNLLIRPEVIEPERKVVQEERRSRVENSPGAKLGEQAQAAMYRNHPYRIPIIGWEHEINAITHADLMDFYRTWYAPNNAVLVVAGDVSAERVFALAEKYYGPIPQKALPARPDWVEPPHLTDNLVTYRDPQVRQPSWSARRLAPSYTYGASEHAYALQVLGDILGGGATSRLYRKLVVEQGIAVSAGAWYDASNRGPSTFGLYGSPRPGGTLDDVAAAAGAVIDELLRDGVTQEEVDAAIRRVQDAAVLALDSLSTPARVLGSALVSGRTIEDVESWPDRIAEVTVEDVNRAAAHVFAGGGVLTTRLLPPAERAEGS